MRSPLFLLDGMVLFPRTVLPLQIIEDRYIKMTDFILTQDPINQMFLLGPQQTSTLKTQISTLCQLTHVTPMKNGYSIVVKALHPVKLLTVDSHTYEFSMADFKSLEERTVLTFEDKQRLLDSLHTLQIKIPKEHKFQNISAEDSLAYLCTYLPINTELKVNLLAELDLKSRMEALLKIIESEPFFKLLNHQDHLVFLHKYN